MWDSGTWDVIANSPANTCMHSQRSEEYYKVLFVVAYVWKFVCLFVNKIAGKRNK